MKIVINFFLNEQEYYSNGLISILDIVKYFGYNFPLVVIEYNNLICDKKNWKKIFIQNGDIIEIVTIVGGG